MFSIVEVFNYVFRSPEEWTLGCTAVLIFSPFLRMQQIIAFKTSFTEVFIIKIVQEEIIFLLRALEIFPIC